MPNDWNNVDLSGNERNAYLIDPLTFETLLLEIGCNSRDINEDSVRRQFEDDLLSRIQEAREVFEVNLQNIVKQARKERNND
jgi:hypothetical protein